MKLLKANLLLALVLSGAMICGPVLARGGHSGGGGHAHFSGGGHSHFGGFRGGAHIGVFVGAPVFWPGYYYPPPYYYPPYYSPGVAVPYSPPAYVEQGSAPAAPQQPQANWWYYCAEADKYYPYVTQCPGGWRQVAPQPPPG